MMTYGVARVLKRWVLMVSGWWLLSGLCKWTAERANHQTRMFGQIV